MTSDIRDASGVVADTPLKVAQAWQSMFFKEFRCNGRIALDEQDVADAAAEFVNMPPQLSPWSPLQWTSA